MIILVDNCPSDGGMVDDRPSCGGPVGSGKVEFLSMSPFPDPLPAFSAVVLVMLPSGC